MIQEALKTEKMDSTKIMYFQKNPAKISKFGIREFDYDVLRSGIEPCEEYTPVNSEDPCYYFLSEILETFSDNVEESSIKEDNLTDKKLSNGQKNKTFQFVPVLSGKLKTTQQEKKSEIKLKSENETAESNENKKEKMKMVMKDVVLSRPTGAYAVGLAHSLKSHLGLVDHSDGISFTGTLQGSLGIGYNVLGPLLLGKKVLIIEKPLTKFESLKEAISYSKITTLILDTITLEK